MKYFKKRSTQAYGVWCSCSNCGVWLHKPTCIEFITDKEVIGAFIYCYNCHSIDHSIDD